jgi:nucleoside-diphosphate-sugar epimerase
MPTSPPSLPKRFLLTGANGFIALHILSQLLHAGYSVVATVRTPTKAAALRAQFSSYVETNLLDIAIVPDMTVPGTYDEIFSPSSLPIDTVLHTASPFLYKAATKSNAEEFLDPAIKGTKILLEAAKKAGTVKRVVMTSSCAAVIDYKREARKGIARKVYTEADWNDVTYEEGEIGDKSTAYRASKKFSELVAWDFVGGLDESGTGAKGQDGFDLVVLCPPAVQGPVGGTVNRIEDLGESNSRFWALYLQSGKEKEIANKMPLHVFVDVRVRSENFPPSLSLYD